MTLCTFNERRSFKDFDSSISTAKGTPFVQEDIGSHASSADHSRMSRPPKIKESQRGHVLAAAVGNTNRTAKY